jgi:hypothetical protein
VGVQTYKMKHMNEDTSTYYNYKSIIDIQIIGM